MVPAQDNAVAEGLEPGGWICSQFFCLPGMSPSPEFCGYPVATKDNVVVTVRPGAAEISLCVKEDEKKKGGGKRGKN